MKGAHPAARYEQLPEEVQNYILRISQELYDKKQDSAVGKALLSTGVSGSLIWFGYNEYGESPPLFSYIIAAVLLIVGWVGYRWEWNKNANEFIPTDEELRYEWELQYIVRRKHQKLETVSDEWDADT